MLSYCIVLEAVLKGQPHSGSLGESDFAGCTTEACSLISSSSMRRQLAASVAALMDNDGAGSQECRFAA